jgi:hypothetical protein
MHQRPAISLAKVGSHLLVEWVILQQLVDFFEHGVDAFNHLWHQRKHVLCLIAIDKHLPCHLHAVSARFLLSFSHVACSQTASQAHLSPQTAAFRSL